MIVGQCKLATEPRPPFNTQIMKTGAILTERETETVKRHLRVLDKLSTERRILEKVRMIHLTVNKAQRRAIKAKERTR